MLKIIIIISIISTILFINLSCSRRWNTSKQEKAIVTVDGLRIREKPKISSPVVKSLPKGSIVEILDQTEKFEEIDGLNKPWYKVEHNNVTGWIFGGYLCFNFYVSNNKNIIAWINQIRSKDSADWGHFQFYFKSKQPSKVMTIDLINSNPFEFALSNNNKYVVIDTGTDIIGEINIYNIETGARVLVEKYSERGNFKWKGEKISFHKVSGYGDCYLLWEEVVFNDGEITSSGIKKKGDYHCLGGKK